MTVALENPVGGSSSIMYHNPQYGVKPRHSGGGPVAIRPFVIRGVCRMDCYFQTSKPETWELAAVSCRH